MRSTFLFAFVALLCGSMFSSTARAQSGTPEETIRAFYKWYVQAVMADKDPLTGDRAGLKRYATTRLVGEIDKMRKGPDGLNGDYFLDAQDFDREWAENIKIGKPNVQGGKATVDVELRGRELGKKKLRVTLRQQGAAWKVDKVAGQ
jgi:hypothetical protein